MTLRSAVARTGRLEPTLVYAKGGQEHGIPLRPELFRSPTFTAAHVRLFLAVEAFAGLPSEDIGRMTPRHWAAFVSRRLRAIRPDWMLLLALVAQRPGPRPAAASLPKAVLIVGWEAGASYPLLGTLDAPPGCA